MKQYICLKCRSSKHTTLLDNGDIGCTSCRIRYSRASVKMYNRFARMLRLYNGEEIYIWRAGAYTPSGEYLHNAQEQCWQEWDGITDKRSTVIPF